MTVPEAITATYLRATGKTSTVPTAKRSKILGLLNFFSREWARERGVNWNSLYNPALSIGNISATDSYDLDISTIRILSDREGDVVRVMHTDGVGYTDYDIVPANTLKDYFWGQNKESISGHVCTRIGGQLVFNHIFTDDDAEYGGDIQVPCYVFTEALEDSDNSEIQVDEPDWVVVRSAAEYVRTDITRQNQFPDLSREANEIMQSMKDRNDGQIIIVDTPWTPLSGIGEDSAWS